VNTFQAWGLAHKRKATSDVVFNLEDGANAYTNPTAHTRIRAYTEGVRVSHIFALHIVGQLEQERKAREEEEAATRERERANLRSIAELWRYVQAQAAANNGPPPPNLVFLHPPTQPAVVDPFLTPVSSCSLP